MFGELTTLGVFSVSETLIVDPKSFFKLGGSKANVRSCDVISVVNDLPFINDILVQALTIKYVFFYLISTEFIHLRKKRG